MSLVQIRVTHPTLSVAMHKPPDEYFGGTKQVFSSSKIHILNLNVKELIPGRIVQSVTCLAADVCLTAISGVASSIPARSHTFVEIDREIISTVILLPSSDLFKKGCCQLQAKVCARITGYPLVQACPGKSVVR